MLKTRFAPGGLLAAACLLAACGGSMKKPEQGLAGRFLTYGPPHVQSDCSKLVTQADKDSCRHGNERVVEEPYQAVIGIRNLGTGEIQKIPLDPEGAYRVVLIPGQYEVCVEGECSDPLEVRMGAFTTYGQRLPRHEESKAPAKTGAPAR
jgi:hypothetical protein